MFIKSHIWKLYSHKMFDIYGINYFKIYFYYYFYLINSNTANFFKLDYFSKLYHILKV